MTKEEKDKEKEAGNINAQVENPEQPAEGAAGTEQPDEKEALKNEAAELKDKFLRLYSEFENYKRRTAKERTELVKTANENVLSSLLPVLDDFERGLKSMNETSEVGALKEGIILIYNKLYKILESKGLKPMESVGTEFNSEIHEAITQIPAGEDMKGKVVDEVEKGYYLNDKVIRFAKVVIGS